MKQQTNKQKKKKWRNPFQDCNFVCFATISLFAEHNKNYRRNSEHEPSHSDFDSNWWASIWGCFAVKVIVTCCHWRLIWLLVYLFLLLACDATNKPLHHSYYVCYYCRRCCVITEWNDRQCALLTSNQKNLTKCHVQIRPDYIISICGALAP